MSDEEKTSRRDFLRIAAGASVTPVVAIVGREAVAQNFSPDATVEVAGRTIPVDVALLGPNGQPTAGFFAALDPYHGPPFEAGWKVIYDPLLRDGELLMSTDQRVVERVLIHVQAHGIKRQDLLNIAELAKEVWRKNPPLRSNQPAPER